MLNFDLFIICQNDLFLHVSNRKLFKIYSIYTCKLFKCLKFIWIKVKVICSQWFWNRFFFCCLVTISYLTPLRPMDCSPPGSSVSGISQAWILDRVAISRASSQPRDQTRISCISGGFFTSEPPGKPRQQLSLDTKCMIH